MKQVPEEIVNKDQSKAAVDVTNTRGLIIVATLAERDNRPADFRKLGAICNVIDTGFARYIGTDLTDLQWQNPLNWQEVGASVEICDQADVELAEPTENTKATSALRAWQGFVYWCTATVFNGLSTSSKTIIGAINSLKSLYDTLFASVLVKQPVNTGICETCPILTADVVRDWATRTLTVQSTKGGTAVSALNPIRFFTKTSGEKKLWELATPQSVIWTDTKGIKYIYFDTDGVLKSSDSVWAIGNITTIWRLYWNPALTGTAKIVREVWECHTNSISADDHIWKHRYGAVWLKGFDLICTVLPTGVPATTGVNTCLSLTGGSCIDDNLQYDVLNSNVSADFSQDLGNTTAANITTANAALMEITYNAPDGTLTVLPATRYPFHFVGDVPQVISAGGVITPVTNNYFFNYYVYAFQDPRFGKVINLRSGGQYATQAEANAETWEQIKAASLTLQDGEVKQLYKTQWEYRTTYDAAVKKSVLRSKTDLRQNAAVTVTASGSATTASNVICTPPFGYVSTDQQSLDNELAANTLKGNTTEHTAPIDADSLGVWDSVASAFKRLPLLPLYNFFVTKSVPPQEASELLDTDVVFGGRGSASRYWAMTLLIQKLIGYLPKDAAYMAASWADVQAICESATCPASVAIHLTNDVSLGSLNTYATNIIFSGRQVVVNASAAIIAGAAGAGTYRMTFESGLLCTTAEPGLLFGSSSNIQAWDVRVRDLIGAPTGTTLSITKIGSSTCTFKYNKATNITFASTNVTASQSDMWFKLLPDGAFSDVWEFTLDNGNIIVKGHITHAGTFAIKVRYKFYQNANDVAVKLFPASVIGGNWVRFEIADYCRNVNRTATNVLSFTVTNFYSSGNNFVGSNFSNVAGAGSLTENQQDDSTTYLSTGSRSLFSDIDFIVDHTNTPVSEEAWGLVHLTGTIL